MKKCTECRSPDLVTTTEQLPFNDVALVEGTLHTCRSCGATFHEFSRVEELSREVAQTIARQEPRLLPEQIRFLRKYLGYSGKDFAEFLSIAAETVSRWESKTSPMQMQLSTEKLIRLMALTKSPITDYGLDRVGADVHEVTKPVFRVQSGHWHIAGGGSELKAVS